MFQSRLVIALGSLALAGVAAAAIAPLTQEGMPSPKKEQHKIVLTGVGEWEGTLTMTDPGGSEIVSECTESVTAIGELWTVSRFECTFEMMGMKMDFTGCSTFGYSAAKKKFVGTWMDSMNPEMLMMEGVQDEESGAIDMLYEGPHPMTREMVPHRNSIVHGKDSYVITFYMTEEGKESKIMTIAMKRKN
jgi:hypothetical protein